MKQHDKKTHTNNMNEISESQISESQMLLIEECRLTWGMVYSDLSNDRLLYVQLQRALTRMVRYCLGFATETGDVLRVLMEARGQFLLDELAQYGNSHVINTGVSDDIMRRGCALADHLTELARDGSIRNEELFRQQRTLNSNIDVTGEIEHGFPISLLSIGDNCCGRNDGWMFEPTWDGQLLWTFDVSSQTLNIDFYEFSVSSAEVEKMVTLSSAPPIKPLTQIIHDKMLRFETSRCYRMAIALNTIIIERLVSAPSTPQLAVLQMTLSTPPSFLVRRLHTTARKSNLWRRRTDFTPHCIASSPRGCNFSLVGHKDRMTLAWSTLRALWPIRPRHCLATMGTSKFSSAVLSTFKEEENHVMDQQQGLYHEDPSLSMSTMHPTALKRRVKIIRVLSDYRLLETKENPSRPTKTMNLPTHRKPNCDNRLSALCARLPLCFATYLNFFCTDVTELQKILRQPAGLLEAGLVEPQETKLVSMTVADLLFSEQQHGATSELSVFQYSFCRHEATHVEDWRHCDECCTCVPSNTWHCFSCGRCSSLRVLPLSCEWCGCPDDGSTIPLRIPLSTIRQGCPDFPLFECDIDKLWESNGYEDQEADEDSGWDHVVPCEDTDEDDLRGPVMWPITWLSQRLSEITITSPTEIVLQRMAESRTSSAITTVPWRRCLRVAE